MSKYDFFTYRSFDGTSINILGHSDIQLADTIDDKENKPFDDTKQRNSITPKKEQRGFLTPDKKIHNTSKISIK